MNPGPDSTNSLGGGPGSVHESVISKIRVDCRSIKSNSVGPASFQSISSLEITISPPESLKILASSLSSLPPDPNWRSEENFIVVGQRLGEVSVAVGVAVSVAVAVTVGVASSVAVAVAVAVPVAVAVRVRVEV